MVALSQVEERDLVEDVEVVEDQMMIVISVVDEEDCNEMEWKACDHIWME